ncbi:type I pantothenate kinase [Methylocapsa palsarum]|uniref:Pantothenate kinase n=1 Tax=Methylocapsa palsarum TaxID=1612308 RepID=A0A1I3VVH9_9HYPH|nr:type I pantothenate kinase [Methylocapsa palsarum]SFJ99202.1 pantothenate kinase [Methylocapsa palsarum]
MDQRARPAALASPYHRFSRSEWAALAADAPLTLTADDLARLRSTNDPISLEDVAAIYLPLSRLLSLYVGATQGLYKATRSFLGADDGKTPFIIGVAGSVSAGKSTLSRVMQALLSRWPNTPKVDLVTTDGFLYPNAVLEREDLMGKKGFPESYDSAALLRFLSDVKAGERHVEAPVYSHVVYDILPGASVKVDRPDILIVEGLNVLLPSRPAKDGRAAPFVSDFFDFSVYLHASERDLEDWFVARFMHLRQTSFREPQSYFIKYADLNDSEAEAAARDIWTRINLRNLRENILPTKPRANLVLTKGASHRIEEVELRKL